MLDIRKWFVRWNVDRYFDMVLEDVRIGTFRLDLLQAFQAKHQSKGAVGKLAYYSMQIHPLCWSSYVQNEILAALYC